MRNAAAQIWNGTAFATYATVNYADFDVALVEQGSASFYYVGNFPTGITTAGEYYITVKRQIGGSVAESDPTVSTGAFTWNGSAIFPLSDTVTSGVIGQLAPIRLARGTQILNLKFYLKSSADHVTPFTSGVCSGQINRDGGTFGALQSGAFTEEGLGFYRVQALTSGDLLANSVSLLFTANGVSGGSSDPCPISVVLQRTSGQ